MKDIIRQRFYAKVRKTDNCWLWIGAKQTPRRSQPIGYGVMVVRSSPRQAVLAHRLSWELHRGPIPRDKCVLHHCDNPPCVNPDHLFLGTQIENIEDCTSKGRKQKGEQHVRAVLKEVEVVQIKRRIRNGDSVCDIASDYGRPHGTIWAISVGRSWRHING